MTLRTAALLTLAPALAAETYYVSPTGSDANDGSLGAPFATPFHALQVANQPGDTVYLRAGVHEPPPWGLGMGWPGAPGSPITLAAYPGELAILDGANTDAGTTALYVATSWVRIEGLEVRNSKGTGISAWGPGSFVHDVEVVGCTVHHSRDGGFYAGTSSLADPVRDVRVAGNTFYRNNLVNDGHPAGVVWGYACGAGRARRVVFEDNLVYENQGEGIGVFLSDHCEIVGNELYDNFSVNLYLDNASDCRVVGNTAYSSLNPEFFRFGLPASGITIANEFYEAHLPSARNVIANNVLWDNKDFLYVGSYQAGGGLRDTLVVHNSVKGSEATLLVVDADPGHTGSVVANNVLRQTGPVGISWLAGSTSGIAFHHNLWWGGTPVPAATGVGDVYQAPAFVDGPGVDLHLAFGSPAVDAGDAALPLLAGLAADADGGARALDVFSQEDCAQAPGTCGTSPLPDLGAFERVADALEAAPAAISLAAGGTQSLWLTAGPPHAGETYLVMGSSSGTTPGFAIDGVPVPLVPDDYFVFTVTTANVPPLVDTLGILDADGNALAAIDLPGASNPGLAGLTLDHAFLTADVSAVPVVTFAGNAAGLELVP